MLGNREAADGLTYTNITRCNPILNLCIPQGVSFDRLTTEITKSKRYKYRIAEEIRLNLLCEVSLVNYAVSIQGKRLCPCKCGRDMDNAAVVINGCTYDGAD